MKIDNNIGDRIRRKRIANGWSQEELAKRMGYSNKSSITRIEKGYNDVSQSKIVKFANILGTSIEYLMGWEELESTKPKTDRDIILFKLEGLTPQEIQSVIFFIDAIRKSKGLD